MSDHEGDESPTSEVGSRRVEKSSNSEELWRQLIERQNQNMMALISTLQPQESSPRFALPEFNPDKESDARSWCATADICFEGNAPCGGQLVIILSKALKGTASAWLSQISYPGITWSGFKDLFSARFISTDTCAGTLINLHSEKLNDSESLAACASRIVTSLLSRWKDCTKEQIAIATTLAHLSQYDSRLQRLAFTTEITTRQQLHKELQAFSYRKRKTPMAEVLSASDNKPSKLYKQTSPKCFTCGRVGHRQAECKFKPKNYKPRSPVKSEGASSSQRVDRPSSIRCFKCGELGHVASRCITSIGSRSGTGTTGTQAERRVDLCVVEPPTGCLQHRGVIFDQNTEEIQNTFKFALIQQTVINKTRYDFQLFVDIINTADAFKLSRLICNQFARGVIAMMGAVTPDSFGTLHSYTNTFQMPFVTPWFPEKVLPPSSGLSDYAVSILPDYHRAVIDTVTYYGWKTVIYIYDSHDGLLRLQQLYQSLQPSNATFHISNVKKVNNASNVVEFLRAIERLNRWSNKYVILDSTTQLAKEALILHVRDVQLGRRNYHYFLSGLVLDDYWEKNVREFGAINITGFRVLDFSRKAVRDFMHTSKRETISAQAALMYDGVQVLGDAIMRLIRRKPDNFRNLLRRSQNSSKMIDCNPKGSKIVTYEHGDKISRMIRKTEIDGLTGSIRFNEKGHRKNFTLQVMELTIDGDMIKVATWCDSNGLIPVTPKLPPRRDPAVYDRNKTYVVISIEESPYMIRNIPDTPGYKFSEPYKGFCDDLTKMLFDKLELTYVIRLVKDGKYGNENPKVIGGWDGIVGELMRKEGDMAVAPLTVNFERETVIDFSRPFLSFDIKSPKNTADETGSIFSFLRPLSKEIWICILCSILIVSIVMFIVSRFSPCEWRLVSFTDTQSTENSEVATTRTTVVNEFSFWNSIWFSLGSFMQQGSNMTPRSISGRIVGSVWWFFTLIVVSYYTANLASYLTLSRIVEPTHAYSKMATCPQDTVDMPNTKYMRTGYGVVDEHGWLSSVVDRNAKIEIKKPCEMIVTITNTGQKDFAIGLPKGSKLREGVNLALQALKNEGELEKLIRKWFTKSEPHQVEPDLRGTELTLNQVAGLFYILLGGLGLGLGVALVEFCRHGRAKPVHTNVPLQPILRNNNTQQRTRTERRNQRARSSQSDQERVGWSGTSGSFSGQTGQEETALHASFTQV